MFDKKHTLLGFSSLLPHLSQALYNNITLESSLTAYMYTVSSTIGTIDTSLGIDINNGFMTYLNSSCTKCESLGMDTTYNTYLSKNFWDLNIGHDEHDVSGTNAEGYSGTAWFGEDEMVISSNAVSTGKANLAIKMTQTGAGVNNPAGFIVWKELEESNWIPKSANLTNFGGFIGLGQFPTDDGYA